MSIIIQDVYGRALKTAEETIFKVKVTIKNDEETKVPLKGQGYMIHPLTKETVKVFDHRVVIKENNQEIIYFEGTIDDPLLWSPDTPYIYECRVDLLSHFDEMVDNADFNIGIRTIEKEDNKLVINGIEGKYHILDLSDAISDRGLDAHNSEQLLKNLKEIQCNTVWVDGELIEEPFIELCDQLGFYVFMKVKVEGGHEMVRRYRNHASIIGWQFVESLSNKKVDLETKKSIAELDEERYFFGEEMPMIFSDTYDGPFEFKWHDDMDELIIKANDMTYPIEECQIVYGLLEDGEILKEKQVEHIYLNDDGDYRISFKGLQDNCKEVAAYSYFAEVQLKNSKWWQKQGYALGVWQMTIKESTYSCGPLLREEHIKYDEDEVSYKLYFENASMEINKETGVIEQVIIADQPLLNQPIELAAVYNKEEMAKVVKGCQINIDDGLGIVECHYKVKGFKGITTMKYTISDQGEMSIEFEGMPTKEFDSIGYVLDLISEPSRVSYYGEGPWNDFGQVPFGTLDKVHRIEVDNQVGLMDNSSIIGQKGYNLEKVKWFSTLNGCDHGFLIETEEEKIRMSIKGNLLKVIGDKTITKGEKAMIKIKITVLNE